MMKTIEGKWVLFDLETGEQREYWSIDAKRLVEAGTHATEAPEGVEPVPPVMPPERVGMPTTQAPNGPPEVKADAKPAPEPSEPEETESAPKKARAPKKSG